jgi:hypothetical protein
VRGFVVTFIEVSGICLRKTANVNSCGFATNVRG